MTDGAAPVERWRAVAARQHGAIAWAQLLDAGLSRHQAQRRLARGELRRHLPAVYLTTAAPPDRWTLAWAAVLYGGPAATFASHDTAAALYLPRLEPPARIDITVVGHNPGRVDRVGVHRSRALPRSEVRYVDRLPVTSPARTVLDLAATRPRARAEYVLQELLFERKVTDCELARVLRGHARRRGAALLAAILELEGPPESGHTRSEAERAFLRLVRDAGLPAPDKQRYIEGAPVDAVWLDRRVVVEIDGARGHGHALARARDRRRDDRLRAADWHVLRFTAREVFEQPLLVATQLATPSPPPPERQIP